MALGIDNVKKLIDLGMAIPKQIAESSADGWQLTDAFAFTDEAWETIKVAKSWKDIAAELKDLDDAERAELHKYFADKFDIPNDQIEQYVEDAIEWAFITIRMIERFKALKK